MQIKPVKTAIVGCGVISTAYLDTMTQKFNILDVIACCDLDEAKAQATAEKYGIQGLTIEEILVDETIELVVNLTTPNAHYPVIKQLLEGGKHVYTEKVLTVELEHAAELVKIADEKNLYLGSAPDTFLGSALQTARYVVDSGMLGEITSCYCAMTRDSNILNRAFPFTAQPGGGDVTVESGRRARFWNKGISFSLCVPLAAVRQGHSICFEIPVTLQPDRRRAGPLRNAGLEMPQNVKRLWIVRWVCDC